MSAEMSDRALAEDAAVAQPLRAPGASETVVAGPRRSSLLRSFASHRPAFISLLLFLPVVAAAALAGFLPIADPRTLTPDVFLMPAPEYPLGTDHLGRDMLARIVWGGRTAILVAIGSAGIAVTIGVVLGSLAGFYGGWVDDLLSRLFDISLLIPAFLLLVLAASMLGSSLVVVMVVIGISSWPSAARIMRSQVLTYKARDFVLAARAAGAGPVHLLARHIVPNSIGPVLTHGSLLMGQAILIEAGLSFLGLGDASTMSWGRMIHEGQPYFTLHPWMSIVPGLAMMIVVLQLNLIGDGLSSVMRRAR